MKVNEKKILESVELTSEDIHLLVGAIEEIRECIDNDLDDIIYGLRLNIIEKLIELDRDYN